MLRDGQRRGQEPKPAQLYDKRLRLRTCYSFLEQSHKTMDERGQICTLGSLPALRPQQNLLVPADILRQENRRRSLVCAQSSCTSLSRGCLSRARRETQEVAMTRREDGGRSVSCWMPWCAQAWSPRLLVRTHRKCSAPEQWLWARDGEVLDYM